MYVRSKERHSTSMLAGRIVAILFTMVVFLFIGSIGAVLYSFAFSNVCG